MNHLQQLILLAGMSLALNCAAQTYPLSFDVEYGRYATVLKEDVGEEGQLACEVAVQQPRPGEKWVPSVILAAAQDPQEDYTLFLSGYQDAQVKQTLFGVRTFNAAKPVLREYFFKTPDHDGRYSLHLTWHKDGSITYQVGSGEFKSEEQVVKQPGFSVRHVSVHASGVRGSAICKLLR